MRTPALLGLALTLVFAGCGGGGSATSTGVTPTTNPTPNGGNTGLSPQAASEHAVNATNALGDPINTITDFNNSITAPASSSIRRGALSTTPSGTCSNGVEFFVPDTNNDPNSTESKAFYDTACTQLARDVVRIFTVNGSNESVNRTEKIFAINNTTPSSVRTDTVTILNATFDAKGFPLVANGFARTSTGELDLAGSKTIDSGNEMVLLAGSNGTNSFCSDSAGFNATGIQSLGETFGWQGAVLTGGTRTVNADGSVTWTATHTGSTFKGAIGALSLATAAPNTACPITTPQFSIGGGTQGGQFSIPVAATYTHSLLTNLTVTNATLANGDTLNVTTNTSASPTSNTFITGIISNNATQIATFNVDTFGDGTLTNTASGAQFVVTNWHVVK